VPELKHFPFFSKAPSHHGIILIYFDLARHCGQYQNDLAVPAPRQSVLAIAQLRQLFGFELGMALP
jgi:hypothetical protein